ncbi:hypothetical protein HDU87_006098 [Geranomyces variabilis]|uniref:Periplasmic binding protein n=1 Tax=Geranomyces variabilis TaxID=109894 RepID=A0AAD5TG54_9FUNG|nr:hypothetical protein HDU87_006098 [Geranomyces variabilis]
MSSNFATAWPLFNMPRAASLLLSNLRVRVRMAAECFWPVAILLESTGGKHSSVPPLTGLRHVRRSGREKQTRLARAFKFSLGLFLVTGTSGLRIRPAIMWTLLTTVAAVALAAAAFPPSVPAQTCTGGPITSVATFDPAKDYFADASTRADTLTYAKNFNVQYFKSYKVVTIRSSGTSKQYTLQLCNATPVTGAIAVPVSSLAIDSSDMYAAAFIERIGQLGTLGHVGPDTSLVSSPCLLKRIAANQTIPYGNGTEINGSASLVFASAALAGAPNTPFISIAAAIRAETTPLARAEWVKFFSLFSNTESTANDLFQNTIARVYDCHANYGKSQKSANRVAWLASSSLQSGPSNSFSSPDESYTSAMISDAGFTPLTLPAGSTRDAATAVLKQTDLFIEDTPVGSSTNSTWDSLLTLYVSDTAAVHDFPFAQAGISGLAFKPDRLRTIDGADYFVYNHWAQPDVLINELLFSATWSTNLGKHGNLFRALPADDNEVVIGPSACVTTDPSASLIALTGLSCPASGDNTATPVGHDGGGGGGKTGAAIGATIAVLLFVAAGVLAWVFRHEILDKVRVMRESHGEGGGDGRWTRAKARSGAIELT